MPRMRKEDGTASKHAKTASSDVLLTYDENDSSAGISCGEIFSTDAQMHAAVCEAGLHPD